MIFRISMFLAAFVMAACSPDNPKKMPPPEVNVVTQLDPSTLEIAADSMVDILFVIDDSRSMKRHQENFGRNIKAFVHEFEKNVLINIHFAVTSASDRKMKEEIRKRHDAKLSARIIDVNPLGELLPPLDPISGQAIEGPRYISKDTPNYLKVLERTLLVGAKPGPDDTEAPTIGPWFEEFFSPVHAVFSVPYVDGINKGFYRPEAFLAVFFISDGDDASAIDAKILRDFLVYDLKKGDLRKVQPYAAIIPSKRSKSSDCPRDSSDKPARIEALLDLFQNGSRRVLDICSPDFGQRLAQFGKEISESLPEKVIEIPEVPEDGSISVYYGAELLKLGTHYSHELRSDKTRDRITIRRDLKVKFEKDAKIRVKYVAARLGNQSNGRTITIPAD